MNDEPLMSEAPPGMDRWGNPDQVRLLLDSNALIWWVTDPGRLSSTGGPGDTESRERDRREPSFPVGNHHQNRKGGLPELGSSIQYLLDEVREQRFELLQLRPEHLLALGRLERHHRDPFDRLLIAQGIAERLPVATSDPSFSKYPVEVFW